MIYGTVMAYRQPSLVDQALRRSLAIFPFTDTKVYIGVTALLINVIVVVVLTVVLAAVKAPAGTDETEPADYYSDRRRRRSSRRHEREVSGASGAR